MAELSEIQKEKEAVLAIIKEADQILSDDTIENNLNNCSDLLDQLQEPFALFVAGEFNSGKSSFINYLAGNEIAKVGVLPTTSNINPLRTKRYLFIDSPGTNSILAGHQETTEKFIKRADAVLFVTSVERPISESEAEFLRFVTSKWKRDIVVVINKCDLRTPSENYQIKEFVENALKEITNAESIVFSVSAKTGEGFQLLEEHLDKYFSSEAIRKIKIKAPLLSLLEVLDQYEKICSDNLKKVLDVNLVFQKIESRLNLRLEEGSLVSGAVAEASQDVFRELSYKFRELIDQHFGFFELLKGKITGKTEKFQGKVFEILEELRLSERLEKAVSQLVVKITDYRDLIIKDTKDLLDELSELKFDIQGVTITSSSAPSPEELSFKLRKGAERGVTKFLTFSSAAALSGIGAKISTVAPLEITAIIAMVSLGIFSFRVIPRERQKLKQEISSLFIDMGEQFSTGLVTAVEDYLKKLISEIQSDFADTRIASIKKEAKLTEIIEKISSLRSRIEVILSTLK